MTTSKTERSLLHRRRTHLQWLASTRTDGASLFLLVVLLMGSGYVVIRVGVESVPPLFLATLRLYLAAIALLLVTLVSGESWRLHSRADWVAVAVLGTLLFAGPLGFLFVGQQYTTVSTAAVVMCLGPVLTACLSRTLVPDEPLSRRQFAGIGFGLIGAVVVATPTSTGLEINLGAVLVFCAALCGSVGSVLLSRIRTTAPLTVQAGWGGLLGGLLLHTASLGLGEAVDTVVWTPALLSLLVYLSVIVGGVGYVAFLGLLRRVGPTRTSFTSYVSPVVAILLGWVLLHEPLTVETALGFGVIVTGFVLLNDERDHPR